MAISMLKIRRPLGRLIFNMGIAIPDKTVFLIETAPWLFWLNIIVERVANPKGIENNFEGIYQIQGQMSSTDYSYKHVKVLLCMKLLKSYFKIVYQK